MAAHAEGRTTPGGQPGPPVLERALATSFVPGTNRRGAVPGGAWTLLLDTLELGHVVCLGLPPERTLQTLGRRAHAVSVVCADGSGPERARRAIDRAGVANATVIGIAEARALGDVALSVVTGRASARRAAADPDLAALLGRSDAVYVELGRGGGGLERRLAAIRPARPLWLGVRGSEVELVAGRDDRAAIAMVRGPAAPAARSARARARALARRILRGGLAGRRGLLAGTRLDDEAQTALPVPEYLRDIAGAAGANVEACRVALTAPADYPSRKAVMFVLAPGAASPRYVVKLTRDPAFNDRLENEGRALRALAAAGVGDAETVPRHAFAGHPGGLALLGQTAIAGEPFRRRTTARPDCPLARAAAEWLLDLGVATADRDVAGPAEVAQALGTLLDRFAALYRPTAAEHAALRAQIDAVARSTEPFPLVLQHGDPGTWNLLVTAAGRPAFLDWEAAEPHGLPLWDLFHFARSVGVGVSRAAGTRLALDAFVEQYLADGPLSRMLARDVEAHCATIGLDRELVGPLFLTCWMHRALKEAMRLTPATLPGGTYVTLLRCCLARPDAPGLTRLYVRAGS
jgi:Phosphotransferase enzyme family